ncbi:MAG TPA: TetR/AcrR family transcriptional regulator [Accumulibacter sp.]|uniref:TetR/AcrR family transcriptional regulator n=1 Tax=Accumulibacter sp. TaxID=2053492 RepID=UPI002613F05F|nr:TetR/AcrR family transcriptional regulator [Accumulibacter sp.]MDS4053580.1 TetR/AcrR family transcriptional regulator [Accumulibacter sp.]HMV05266.1 TetR/AcrR family transcriptional regulator [Accumulibacter sp.]HMW62810.1 TetR/AcrR family transcriptional regulator [Accumulibacter sp.]HMW79839.1 TetR/AcrR family transcriptional regulator [Accumulibacter sp.]HMX68125.1 TetR/AcrR family transcriptional regulator [Accumulibacter sp.]
MERKPKRRTRERIIETSLRLFNEFGEPNVTTTVIADEMNISPGNLYYHFHNKDEIIEAIFSVFERQIEETLAAPTRRLANVEDIWLFLHLLFEEIWAYRFFYRDLNDLLTRNRLLEIHFCRILAHKVRTAQTLCDGLVSTGAMRATAPERRALAINVAVLASYWLSFEYARDPRAKAETNRLGRGVYQVMAMLSPFLVGDAKGLFDRLAREYVAP